MNARKRPHVALASLRAMRDNGKGPVYDPVAPVVDDIPSPVQAQRQEVFAGLTQQELEDAFNMVKPAANWKDAIEARVYLNDAELRALVAAVPYFTGGAAFVVPVAGEDGCMRKPGDPGRVLYRVSAAGYYACVGA